MPIHDGCPVRSGMFGACAEERQTDPDAVILGRDRETAYPPRVGIIVEHAPECPVL